MRGSCLWKKPNLSFHRQECSPAPRQAPCWGLGTLPLWLPELLSVNPALIRDFTLKGIFLCFKPLPPPHFLSFMGGKTLISDQKDPKIHMAFQVAPTAGPLTSESSPEPLWAKLSGPRPTGRPGGSKREQQRHPISRIPGKEGIRTATASTQSFKTCSKQTFLATAAEEIRSPRDTRPNRPHLPGLGQLSFG